MYTIPPSGHFEQSSGFEPESPPYQGGVITYYTMTACCIDTRNRTGVSSVPRTCNHRLYDNCLFCSGTWNQTKTLGKDPYALSLDYTAIFVLRPGVEPRTRAYKAHDLPLNYLNSCSSRGGTRTRTGISAHWILSPACLPIPPPGQVI